MTIKQQVAIKKTVENGGNISQAMREAGYSEATINNPSNLTQSKSYKATLKEAGLDERLIVNALVDDIKQKPQNRIRELSLAAEILGMKSKTNFEYEDRRRQTLVIVKNAPTEAI